MPFDIVPKHELFAAEIRGLDLRRPISDIAFDGIREAIYKYAVLIFPDQDLTPPDHIAFSNSDIEKPVGKFLFKILGARGILQVSGENHHFFIFFT